MCSQATTLSHIYGFGKKLVFENFLKRNFVFHSCANTFTSPRKNPADIMNLGNKAMLSIFWEQYNKFIVSFVLPKLYKGNRRSEIVC